MTEEEQGQIHEAAYTLCRLIGKYSDEKCIVMWGALYEEKNEGTKSCSGISIGDNVKQAELEHFCFSLLGRAYNMIDFTDQE